MARNWKPGAFKQADLAEVALVATGRERRDGDPVCRYQATLINGEQVWLPRLSSFLDALDGDGSSFWGAQEAVRACLEWARQEGGLPVWELERRARWLTFAPRRTLDEAGALGDRVHGAIRDYLTGGAWPEGLPEPDGSLLESWARWWETAGLRPVAVEESVCDLDLGFGGTLDLRAQELAAPEGPGSWVLIDWKTGRPSEVHGLQLLAYAGCVARGLWGSINPLPRCRVVYLQKDGSPARAVEVFRDQQEALDTYTLLVCGVLPLARWRQSAATQITRELAQR